jgi:transposase
MQNAILGIDIAKVNFQVSLLVDDHERGKSFPNNPKGFIQLDHWLSNRGVDQVHACLEATGSYGEALAIHLADAGHMVSVVNPRRIHAFAGSELQRNKTDALDAGVIARFCKAMTPAPWRAPAPEIRELQSLGRRLASLQTMRQQELNRQQVPGLSPAVAQSVSDLLAYLDAEIERVENLVHKHIHGHPHLRQQRDLLTSIPGIGDATAAVLLGETPDVLQFSSAKQLAAFAGLSPSQRQSGTSLKGQTRLSKIGNPRLRKALFYPAMVAMSYNPLLRECARRWRAAGKKKMVIIGALMRKLLHLAYGILKSGHPFDPQYLKGVG